MPCEKHKSTHDNAKNVNFNFHKFPGFLEAADPMVIFTGRRKQLVRRNTVRIKMVKKQEGAQFKIKLFSGI